jgi:hypothetical protein
MCLQIIMCFVIVIDVCVIKFLIEHGVWIFLMEIQEIPDSTWESVRKSGGRLPGNGVQVSGTESFAREIGDSLSRKRVQQDSVP